MKKLLIILIIVTLAVATIFVVPGQREDPVGKPVVKIGVIIPLSGNIMTTAGNIFKTVLQHQEAELEKRDTRYQYKFIVEDSQFDSKRTALATAKLINRDKVDAIISFGSRVGNVVSPVAERHTILHLSACASDANVATGKYNFIHWTQPEKEVEKMAFEIQKRGYKNIAAFVANDAATIAMHNALADKLKILGIKYKHVTVNPDAVEFRTEIQKLKQNQPDLYVLLVYEAPIVNLIKQSREAGITAPFTSIETFSFLTDASILEGYWYVDSAEVLPDKLHQITQITGMDNTFAVGNFYDSMNLLVIAFENSESPGFAVKALSEIKEFDGAVGRLTQDSSGIFQSEAVIKQIQNGRPVVIDR